MERRKRRRRERWRLEAWQRAVACRRGHRRWAESRPWRRRERR